MSRQCGACTLCCKLLPVHDGVLINGKRMQGNLDKPAGERCRYQRHTGCTVYNTALMPACCKMWNCRWLGNDDTGDLSRPDRSHYVIDIMPDYVTVVDNAGGGVVDLAAFEAALRLGVFRFCELELQFPTSLRI